MDLIRNVIEEKFITERKAGETTSEYTYQVLGFIFHPSTKGNLKIAFEGMLKNAMIPHTVTHHHAFENEYLEISIPEGRGYDKEVFNMLEGLVEDFKELFDGMEESDEQVLDDALFSDESGGLTGDSSGVLDIFDDGLLSDSVTLGDDEHE